MFPSPELNYNEYMDEKIMSGHSGLTFECGCRFFLFFKHSFFIIKCAKYAFKLEAYESIRC